MRSIAGAILILAGVLVLVLRSRATDITEILALLLLGLGACYLVVDWVAGAYRMHEEQRQREEGG